MNDKAHCSCPHNLRYLRYAIRRALRRTLCAPASAITDANAPRPMFPAAGNGPAPGQYSATCANVSMDPPQLTTSPYSSAS